MKYNDHVGEAIKEENERLSRSFATSFYLSDEEKEKMDKISVKELGVKNRNGLLRRWINLYEL